ncbi:Envelope glycoprotein [Cystobasidiomycetes sp. EMM_F5]
MLRVVGRAYVVKQKRTMGHEQRRILVLKPYCIHDPNCNSIISPAFLAACWYITLGKLMAVLGPQYSRFYPRTYGIIFVCGDLLSLIVQAFGGATAAGAATLEDANKGSNIMVIGVIIQMIVRFRKTRATAAVPAGSLPYDVERKARLMIMAMAISTFFVFIRSIYRTIELLNGWHGSIIRNETLFCILDAVCVLLAMVILNVLNPGWLVPAHSMTSDSKVEMENFTEESLHKS